MAHMKPVVEHMVCYHVDTNQGTEIVPENVCGKIDLTDAPSLLNECQRVLRYCEGNCVNDIERKEGFYSRLSANGYMDCTDWNGPYTTAELALNACKEQYECDDEGNNIE